MKLKTIITTLSLITLTACGGGSSSSNTAADVTNECSSVRVFGDRYTYFNNCDFNVSFFFSNPADGVTQMEAVVEPGRITAIGATNPGALIRLCRSPSIASASGCS